MSYGGYGYPYGGPPPARPQPMLQGANQPLEAIFRNQAEKIRFLTESYYLAQTQGAGPMQYQHQPPLTGLGTRKPTNALSISDLCLRTKIKNATSLRSLRNTRRTPWRTRTHARARTHPTTHAHTQPRTKGLRVVCYLNPQKAFHKSEPKA